MNLGDELLKKPADHWLNPVTDALQTVRKIVVKDTDGSQDLSAQAERHMQVLALLNHVDRVTYSDIVAGLGVRLTVARAIVFDMRKLGLLRQRPVEFPSTFSAPSVVEAVEKNPQTSCG